MNNTINATGESCVPSDDLERAFSAIEQEYLRARTGQCRLETPAEAELLLDKCEINVENLVVELKAFKRDTRMSPRPRPDENKKARIAARMGMAAVATLHELCNGCSDWTASKAIWIEIRRQIEEELGLAFTSGTPEAAYQDLAALSTALRHCLGAMDDQSVWRALALQVAVAACEVLINVVWSDGDTDQSGTAAVAGEVASGC